MITLSIIGLDPYLVRQISKEMTPKLANLYEISKDEINFYAPECLYIHDGVEQNTWNVLVKVDAPLKVKVLEKDASKIIEEYLKDACINLEIIFSYYSLDNRYEFLNKDYPRFMTEKNTVEVEEYDEESEEDSDEEPYLGNVFEGLEDKLK
ncbi:MAG: hypothetical protein IAC58_06745 [Firmicutes bacterium]|uniref:Uncharacterized protein n=1 Tax=Candidatus Onthovivens merdipullorum TaxID=2840889 RepID=A0A9D9DIA3_9BACL|nr:hypothetical protein [Candidatus Onthovivens merdipullorum]